MNHEDEESWSDDYCDEYDEYFDRAENYYNHTSCGPGFGSKTASFGQSFNRAKRNIENALSKGFRELGTSEMQLFC